MLLIWIAAGCVILIIFIMAALTAASRADDVMDLEYENHYREE